MQAVLEMKTLVHLSGVFGDTADRRPAGGRSVPQAIRWKEAGGTLAVSQVPGQAQAAGLGRNEVALGPSRNDPPTRGGQCPRGPVNVAVGAQSRLKVGGLACEVIEDDAGQRIPGGSSGVTLGE